MNGLESQVRVPGARDRARQGRARPTADADDRSAHACDRRRRRRGSDRRARTRGSSRTSPALVARRRSRSRAPGPRRARAGLRSDLADVRAVRRPATGRTSCAASCAGSAPSSARCATSKSCATACATHATQPARAAKPTRRGASCAASTPIARRRARDLLASMRRPATRKLRDALDRASSQPAAARPRRDDARAEALAAVVRERWQQAAQRASTSSATNPPDEALHAVRIRAKRCRYAAEACVPAFGKPARAIRRRRSPTCRTCSASTTTRWSRRVARQDRARVHARPRRTRSACSREIERDAADRRARRVPERRGAREPQAIAAPWL